jgi:hypothetical protein
LLLWLWFLKITYRSKITYLAYFTSEVTWINEEGKEADTGYLPGASCVWSGMVVNTDKQPGEEKAQFVTERNR